MKIHKEFILIFGLFASPLTFSCSCRGMEIIDLDKDSYTVFVGQLNSKNSFVSPTITKLTFNAIEQYKGDKKDRQVVYVDKWDCPPPYKKNATYVVFAYRENERLKTNICYSWIYDEYPAKTQDFESFYLARSRVKAH